MTDQTSEAAIAVDLMNTALCRTTHPADAASVLIMAAGELLYTRFGLLDAIDLLHASIDDAKEALMQKFGQEPGEPAR